MARKDEIARRKGLPARPKFKGKPSGMEKPTSLGSSGKGRSKRGRESKRHRWEAVRVVAVKIAAPPGSRFLGYEDIIVEDLRITLGTVRYRTSAGRGDRANGSSPPRPGDIRQLRGGTAPL
jgi:hypothetical protein